MTHSVQRPLVSGDPERILDRHAIRRSAGVSTVSLLVGPIGAGSSAWRHWAATTGHDMVIARRDQFPIAEWIRSVTEKVDVPVAVVQNLGRRASHEPNAFLAAWRDKSPADRERFWRTLPPDQDDDLLRAVASLAGSRESSSDVAALLSGLGDRVVPLMLRVAPSAVWPCVLFIADSNAGFSGVSSVAVQWAATVPPVPIAVVVNAGAWDDFLTRAPESRTKALLREGEIAIAGIDAATVETMLFEAGVTTSAVTVLTRVGPDADLLEAAVSAARATVLPPSTEADDDQARSAAERFLFHFLESLPETAGRFELNATLDFPFGSRLAEVDLLCRSPGIAIELDGYFHFLKADSYRRDRAKDWELQRRGYLVLRFLSEDVIPQLEVIRDRILAAFAATAQGGTP